MSTQINVTVGSGGLSDKARQLQTAARQAQLEKERQQRVEAEGTEQRNAKLEAEGKAPDGSPLYNVPFNQPQIDRRPAANRISGYPVAVGYLDNYENTFYLDTISNSTMPDKSKYKVYSGDGTVSVSFELEYPRYPAPELRWGTTSYTTSKYFFSGPENPQWSSGYEEDPYNPGLILGLTAEANPYSDTTNAAFIPYLFSDEFYDAACTNPTGRRLYNKSNDPSGTPFTPGIMYRNWEWWQTSPTLTGTEHIFTRRLLWQYGPYINTYCLPVSNTSFILFVSFVSGKYFNYYGQRLGYNAVATSYGMVESYTEGPIFSELGYVWYKRFVSNGQSNKTVFLVDQFNEIYENKNTQELAFLVTPNSVKQISFPSNLLSKVSNLHPGIISTPDWELNTTLDSEVNFRTANINSTGAYSFIDGFFNVILAPPANVVRYQRKIYNTTTTINNFRPSPTIPTELLKSYGLARLTDGAVDSTSYTPGMYSMLDNATAIRLSTNDNLLVSYDTTKSNYLADYPVKNIYLDNKQTLNQSDQLIRSFLYSTTQPETRYTALLAADLKKNNTKPVLTLSARGVQYQAWSWQNAGFCRSKLLALGFTTADLTP